jgi:hypothetical protein
MTTQYRAKTQPVRALRFTRRNVSDFDALATETELFGYTYDGDSDTLFIHQPSDGDRYSLVLNPGDWLVIRADGALIRYQDNLFTQEYEPDPPTIKDNGPSPIGLDFDVMEPDEPQRVPVQASPSVDAALAGLGDIGTWAKAIGDLSQQVITMTQLWQDEARKRAEAERTAEARQQQAAKAEAQAKTARRRMVGWRRTAEALHSSAEALRNLIDRARKDTGVLPDASGMEMWRTKIDADWANRPANAGEQS